MSQVITRFAPSPTGFLHAGNYRTAVFAYLFARHHNGKFIVRIEDTDAARSTREYEDNIFESLEYLSLTPDERYRQSDHRPRHRELLEHLIATGDAYISKETPVAPGDREEVIRFRNPGGSLTFHDVIHGDITTPVDDLKDFIIARSLDEPVFHFAVVVDDADEHVTHVIRGGDHISNTARQMLIGRALGFETPTYAHLPLIMDPSRKKLSKRTGAKPLTSYRDQGILPEAMLNYLSFLGWNPGTDQEYLSREQLIEAFDLARVQKGSAVFDEVKLLSVNQYWMRQLSDDDFVARGQLVIPGSAEVRPTIVRLLKERTRSFAEAREMLEGELKCLSQRPTLAKDVLLQKEPADRPGLTALALAQVHELIGSAPDGATADKYKQLIMPHADALESAGKGGRGGMLWPLRYALSGEVRSPDPFTLLSIIGKEESLSRITSATDILKA